VASILKSLERGLDEHRSGRLERAETLYRQVLNQDPANPDALHLIGVVAYQQGRYDQAVSYVERAIERNGTVSTFHYSLGNAWQSIGNLERAIGSFSRAVELNGDHFDASLNLGNALRQAGRHAEAAEIYRGILAARPDYPEPWNNLGNAVCALGETEKSLEYYLKALALRPQYPEALVNLGNALQHLGRNAEAADRYHDALALWPDSPEVWNNLGNAEQNLERYDEALATYAQGLRRNPSYAPLYSNTGNTLRRMGRYQEARAYLEKALSMDSTLVEAHNTLGVVMQALGDRARAWQCFHEALKLKPDYGELYSNLGNLARENGRFEDAASCYRRSIELAPKHAAAYNNLGTVLGDCGLYSEATASFQRAIDLAPEYSTAHSNYLFYLHYDPALTPEYIAHAHKEWNNPAAHERFAISARRPGPLRIGYVSSDFRAHSVAYFVEPVLEHHTLEFYCYADVLQPDETTARLQALAAGRWRDIHGLTDRQAAELIRKDSIDILIDLGGHTGNNRLPVFAFKPAPVQVTWIGYPNTTGLAAIDYRFTDAWSDPEGETDSLHAEKLIRLPYGFNCYRPPADAPPVAARSSGPLTFGSFNALVKISPRLVRLWSCVLQAVPGSRLLLKSKPLAEATVRCRVREQFLLCGIDAERLDLVPAINSRDGHLGAYGAIDIALDTYPYNGTTTTCEALWMGVPVLTLSGRTHVSRVGVSLLSRCGMTGWIARDEHHFIELAIEKAAAIDELRAGRAAVRESARALTAASAFTAQFEQTLKEIALA
jgi:protein O-GlcNAc transferase